MAWRLADVTLGSDPTAHGDPAGYTTGAVGVETIVFKARYLGGHIHALLRDPAGWQHADLTAASGAPASAGAGFGSEPTAYFVKRDGTHHVVWFGDDQHVHELVRDAAGWRHADISSLSGAPSSAAPTWGTPAAYWSEARGTRSVVFLGMDQHLHRLWCDAAGWHYEQLPGQPNPVMISPAAYLDGDVEHIYFVGADAHIYELTNGGGAWVVHDVLLASGAPVPASGSHDWIRDGLTAYAVAPTQTQYVVYLGWEGHVHELSRSGGGLWRHTDLTFSSGAPASAAPNLARPTAYVSAAQGTRHVVYCGDGGHVHELYCDAAGWHHQDLSAAAGAPSSALAEDDAPACFANDADGTQHVAYLGRSTELHEVWRDGAGWHYANLTRQVFCPLATGSPVAHEDLGATKRVTFRGRGGHVDRLTTSGPQWTHLDLSRVASAPVPVLRGSSPAEYFVDPIVGVPATLEGVAFVGEDLRVHLLRRTRTAWSHLDLTRLTAAPEPRGSSPTAYVLLSALSVSEHVVYIGADQHLHSLEGDQRGWRHVDLTKASGAPPSAAPAGSPASGYVVPLQSTHHVVYAGQDRHVHQLSCSGGVWRHDDVSRASGAPPASDIGGVAPTGFAAPRGAHHVVFPGVDGHVHELQRLVTGRWMHTDLTAASGAPVKASPQGSPVGHVLVGGSIHVVYRGEDGLVHDLCFDPAGWQYDPLAFGAPGAMRDSSPAGYAWPGSSTGHPEFVYVGTDGHVYVISYYEPGLQ
jgi:hypothetical protein